MTAVAQTAVANAFTVATQNAELQAALAGQATSQAEAQGAAETVQAQLNDANATMAVQAAEIAGWPATGTAIALPTTTPTPAPTETPTPSPIPTATPLPSAGTVLYETSEETDGFEGWTVSTPWKRASGLLISDGLGTGTSFPQAPIDLGPISDYAVEAEIQLVRRMGENCGIFGVFAREEGSLHYFGGAFSPYCYDAAAGLWASNEQLASVDFDPGDDWHTYRLEVQGTTIRLLIDGALVMETRDNRLLSSGRVGLAAGQTQIAVRRFAVIAL